MEKNISRDIARTFDDLHIIDCWTNYPNNMTWKHGDKMSKIDRIWYTPGLIMDNIELTTDWTYIDSDHAAVILKFVNSNRIKRERVTRIDTRFMNNVLLKHKFLCTIRDRMKQLNETNMNPHQELEYLKMTIRSIALEIASEVKKESEREQQRLKDNIDFWQNAFVNSKSQEYKSLAESHLNDLMAERDKYLEERGEYLSKRVKTKWYQESEKNTKYFLNMQRAKANKSNMNRLTVNGVEVTDLTTINNEIETFYRSLYEKGDSKIVNESKLNDYVKIQKLENEKICKMNLPIAKEDLLQTLNSCSDSAPGPDGIPYSLIKLTWNYFGDLLIKAWNFSKETNELTASHRSSYLRLIPKDGKDITQIKNWRPITLSNCDFKLITKTLSKKLTLAVADTISSTQAAYIPGRQITNNLHLILNMIEASSDEDVSGMLVSLDAEKAFDSVEHWYIKAILKKLGLDSFIETFNLLYKDQTVDILLNGGKAGSYKIKNGVKQGDALSCIIFILCMEPLIQNIQDDPEIVMIKTKDRDIPKIVAYADDIACMINPDQSSIERIFYHYGYLTDLSGLKLNADKTEIISNSNIKTFNIVYQNQRYELDVNYSMKVNGLTLTYDLPILQSLNFNKLYTAMSDQLRIWSKRNLSILGKILIYKTFGLSQILYIGSVIQLTKKDEAKITELIYKFIWNRDMDKLKAPDRIKRSTLAIPIKELGFGMIDFRDIIKSIRINTVIKALNNNAHPLNKLIMNNVNSSWIKIKTLTKFRPPLMEAIKYINAIWKNYIGTTEDHSKDLLKLMLGEYIGNLLEPKHKKNRLARRHQHDTLKEILTESWNHEIIGKLEKNVRKLLEHWNGTKEIQDLSPEKFQKIPIKQTLIKHDKITSKLIRSAIHNNSTLSEFRVIGRVNPEEVNDLGRIVKSLTNTKLKTSILRLLHGDIFCGSRLKRFGMTDNDKCIRCNQIETIEHMYLTCVYTKRIWSIIKEVTNIEYNSMKEVTGLSKLHDRTTVTINAEIIRQLSAIDRPTLDPKLFVHSIIKRLSIIEKGLTKIQIAKLLERFE